MTDIDLHQKDAKKPEKLGKCRSMYLIYILYAREKKSKIFFYIERYGNDLHRPTSFLFHRLEERSFSHTKQKHLQLLLYVNQHLAQAFSFIFVGFAPVPKATVTDCHEKVQKSPKTGKKRRQCRKGNTQKNFRFLGKVCKRPTSTDIRPPSKRCKKARKTGRM